MPQRDLMELMCLTLKRRLSANTPRWHHIIFRKSLQYGAFRLGRHDRGPTMLVLEHRNYDEFSI
jgi:hypothetical protein